MSEFNLSTQEIFDIAYKGVTGQGRLCQSIRSGCKYSDGYGAHCAVGHVLLAVDPNCRPILDLADQDMISPRLDEIGKHADITGINEHLKFLYRLQVAHDQAADMGHYVSRMKNLAEEHSLEFSEWQPNGEKID